MQRSPLISGNFIDSCAFDPKYAPENEASAEIFGLARQGKLLIRIAHSTLKEIKHPNTPNWVKHEAQDLIYTIKVSLTDDELEELRYIETILAGNGKLDSIRQDAVHIFEAQKYGSYFITVDLGILNRANELRTTCRIIILKPSEYLSLVKQYFCVRYLK